MNSQQLIEKLGYVDNPVFLKGERLREHHGYSFFFAQAEKEEYCNLKGVYTLLYSPDKLSSSSLTPVVYVCEADNEAKAEEIHKRVWNQNIVPFLIVVTPKNIRLYSGFEYDYDRKQSDEERVLEVAINAKEVLDKLSAFKSESIDSGDIWKRRPISVEGRVDRHLLANLEKLSEVLTDENKDYKLPIEHAHTLIGKYIYLQYLRDRDILSDKRLEKAKINVKVDDIFGSNANKNKLYQLEKYLNGFLNGSVFPLPSINDIRPEHIEKVACTFKGGDPESGQGSLFDMYDFSCIPIETLSVVYQQFLHQKGKGKQKGAYYTPVHLVNSVLDELDAKKPLKEGMKIFDPSCGSGAFLVQCYRRLVESVVRNQEDKLKPTDLRKLLVDNIFGLDADKEACWVAELSLSLTLLDYIEPHDLTTYPTFKLPELHNKNIFHCEEGFFDDKSLWTKSIPKKGYDWIVGNPPWKNKEKYEDDKLYDQKALHWININRKTCPVDNYQTAEAFAWKTTELLAEDGQCGLLMPAKTLFKKQGDKFRAKFFSEIETWCIVNFANI
ncbi:MAG: N-6 DNA methylase, partial [Desulfobacteraceae bacterium]|nr:N-6 DNA methylase [Desulfobacteraceae bacterium]